MAMAMAMEKTMAMAERRHHRAAVVDGCAFEEGRRKTEAKEEEEKKTKRKKEKKIYLINFSWLACISCANECGTPRS
jgi:hypothetical protein